MLELSEDVFRANWQSMYETVFTGRTVSEGAFTDSRWQQVLFPEIVGQFSPSRRESLNRACASVHDSEFVALITEEASLGVSDGERCQPWSGSKAVLTGWSDAELRALSDDAPFHFALDMAAFGRSGQWGLLQFPSEDGYTCFAGTPSVMGVFVEVSGGLELLKADFIDFCRSGWYLADSRKRLILEAVGWGELSAQLR